MTIELNENLIIFRIQFESYKYLVFFFKLINDFATFQNFINDTLMKYFDKFVVTYLNDILIYNNNIKKHKKHVRKILQKFRKIDIQTNVDKCEFHKIETKFLNVLIEKNEIRMNSIKIAAIIAWKTLKNLIQIQSFFEFVNFYRRFIKIFSKITKTLTRMTKKNFDFEWTFVCESIFRKFKKRVIEVLILIHFNFQLKTTIESNSNDYVSVEILFQKKKRRRLICRFFFQNFIVDEMQLRNLWQKIVNNHSLFWKMKIRIAINQQINQNSDRSQIFKIFHDHQKIKSKTN